MSDYLPEEQARALVAELFGFRVAVTDGASLHTVRGLREAKRLGLRLQSFVLGTAGSAAGPLAGPVGTERAVCVARGLPAWPHLVVEPDGWLVRARGLLAGEKTLARGDGLRVGSREPEAWDGDAAGRLLALSARRGGVGVEVDRGLAVAWRERATAPWLLADVLVDLQPLFPDVQPAGSAAR